MLKLWKMIKKEEKIFIIILCVALFKFSKNYFQIKYEIFVPLELHSEFKHNHSDEFRNLIEKYCNTRNDKLGFECIEKLGELDKRISKQSTGFNPCDKCLKFNNETLTIYHHTFWQLNELKSETSMFYRRTIFLNIMSYLTTQNLCCTKFIFWKLKEFPQIIEEDIRKTFAYYINKQIIEVKLFNLTELCASQMSSFNKSQLCIQSKDKSLAGQHMISLSDLVRFVVLDIYGGIYTDGDVIYLKYMHAFF